MIRAVLFDWGDTLMRDLPAQHGPMCDWPAVEPMPGAAETLTALRRRGLRTALATNAADSDEAQIRRALRRGGLEHALDAVFCARALGCRKPEPAFFAACCAQLGLPPAAVLMVGDDLQADVLGAQAAGLSALWLRVAAPRIVGVQAIDALAALPALLAAGQPPA
ncbi:putative hydrolase of the HAD superfamily [Plasticicumulans acidivorans]|uniref:Putative hydrolase of the HAD superfamily n=2 Tax=Plasticicumulans acidivorans TaxID=886464 RepID=A0A317MQM1_9GAMM|nr:putative hydrolase of the HAD superfamily [Plasticicumulans acidivorans]